MKNQNDLIISITAAVIGVAIALCFVIGQPAVTRPTDPQPVPTDAAKLPAPEVQLANSLPGGSTTPGGGMGGMAGGAGSKWANMGMAGPGSMGRPGLSPGKGGASALGLGK